MTKSKQGGGTTRTIRDRATGAVLGYQALMPRGMSKAPPGCKNPKTYQQKVGPRCATRAAALLILAEAITARKEVATLSHGLTFSHYLRQEMKAVRTISLSGSSPDRDPGIIREMSLER